MGIDLLRPGKSGSDDAGARRAKDVMRLVEDMRDDFNLYDFGRSWETLDSIYDQASRHGYVTEGQLRAVCNIKAGAEENDRRRRERRFGRRW